MVYGKTGCMKCLAREGICSAAVKSVADKRKAEVLHMDANLMRAACLKAEAKERKAAVVCKAFVMRNSGLSIGGDDAQNALGVRASDRAVDGSSRRHHLPFNNGKILAGKRLAAAEKENMLRLRFLRDEDET